MKIIDKGKILDKLCEYLNSHKKETGMKIVRLDNTKASLQENKWFPSDLGNIKCGGDDNSEKELIFSMWKESIDKNENINFDGFKNLLKTFEIKNKIDVVIEMN